MKDFIKGLLGAKSSQTEEAWVSPENLRPGPIQHQNLTPAQLAQIETIHETFHEIDGLTIRERIDSFMRDLHIDRELSIYNAMVIAFRKSTLNHTLSKESQIELYKVLLLRSMTSEEEVFGRITLKSLPRNVAESAIAQFARVMQ